LSEKNLKGASDADIFIDYTKSPPFIEFSNVKHSKPKGWGWPVPLVLTGIIDILIAYGFPSSLHSPLPLLFLIAPSLTMIFWFLIDVIHNRTFNNPSKLQRYFQRRTRRTPLSEVELQNPQGTIKYTTSTGNPLIDLEMDEDVRKHLQNVRFIRIEKKKKGPRKLDQFDQHELTITFDGESRGAFTIREYDY
jgi:hypothetical protein